MFYTLDVAIDLMVKAVRRIGTKHSSVASQKRAIAMMVGADSITHRNDGENENSSAMAAPAHKRKKVGRCKFHDGCLCKYGDRCRMNRIGAAGNGRPPTLGHTPYYSPGRAQAPQSSVHSFIRYFNNPDMSFSLTNFTHRSPPHTEQVTIQLSRPPPSVGDTS